MSFLDKLDLNVEVCDKLKILTADNDIDLLKEFFNKLDTALSEKKVTHHDFYTWYRSLTNLKLGEFSDRIRWISSDIIEKDYSDSDNEV